MYEIDEDGRELHNICELNWWVLPKSFWIGLELVSALEKPDRFNYTVFRYGFTISLPPGTRKIGGMLFVRRDYYWINLKRRVKELEGRAEFKATYKGFLRKCEADYARERLRIADCLALLEGRS
jgi:hypothetical protein